MPNNIQIYCRVRPSRKPSGFFDVEPDTKLIEFQLPQQDSTELVNNTKVSHRFMFDGLFGMDCTQDAVFETVAKDAVDNTLNGRLVNFESCLALSLSALCLHYPL